MNSTSGAFGRWSACADREGVLCVGGGRRLARSALEGRFQSAQKPSAGGWPARRMNSASRSLRPVVGLRRPGRGFASAEADAWRAAPWKADFNRRKSLRPMVGIRAEWIRPQEAFGRWSVCADREVPFASAEADAWRAAPGRADFNRRKSLRPVVGLRRPGGGFASAEADAWRAAPW